MKPVIVGYNGRVVRRKRSIWGRLFLFFAVFVLLPVLAYFGWIGISINDFVIAVVKTPAPTSIIDYTPEPTETSAPEPTQLPGEATHTPAPIVVSTPSPTVDASTFFAEKRINILVLGTDKRVDQQAARSDTLIIVSIDPQQKTAGILSVPRDLRVKIPGYEGYNKINAAYFFGEFAKSGGGPNLATITVQNTFGIRLDYFLTVNFEGFQKVVDMVGGVQVYVPEEITDTEYPDEYNGYKTVHFDAGCQSLDGERALEYSRTRHADSDFSRAKRQQQVMLAIRDKALQLNMITSVGDLLKQFSTMIETDIPLGEQLSLANLVTQIKREDIYTAQIDASMVTPQTAADGSEDLVLNTKKANPMLDWFFGRGQYAEVKPGSTFTPTATATSTATPRGYKTPTPEPTAPSKRTTPLVKPTTPTIPSPMPCG